MLCTWMNDRLREVFGRESRMGNAVVCIYSKGWLVTKGEGIPTTF